MNKLKRVPLFFLSLLLTTLLFAGVAEAKPSEQLKKDVRLAGNVMEKVRNNITTTINTNNSLPGEIRSVGLCAANIIKASPGWDFDSKPSREELKQTNAAYFFAYQLTVGRVVADDTLQAGYWAEGTLRSAGKYYVSKKSVKSLLVNQANIVKDLRMAGGKTGDVCAILAAWQSAGYTGIYNLVNAEWGTDGLQKAIKSSNEIYNKIYKANMNILNAGANANRLWGDVYTRAWSAYFGNFWWEDMAPAKKAHAKRMIG